MFQKYTTLIALFGLSAMSSFGATRSVQTAQSVAEKALSNSSFVSLTDVHIENQDTLYYVFSGISGGFAFVSADDRTPALLAFNRNNLYDADNIPQPLKLLLKKYADEVAHLAANEKLKTVVPAAAGAGSSLKASRLTGCSIAPLLGNMEWGQATPYNDKCPVSGDGHCPTGCKATAMAQVMNYYQYPAAVVTEIPAYTTSILNVTIPAVAKGTTFDWSNMLDSYLDTYTTEQAEAVANLMAVCGSVLNMTYNGNSSASDVDESVVMPKYFGYDADLALCIRRSVYTLTEWNEILYNELANGRPVIMGASSMGGGHAFICDGISSDGLFHINWGWDGAFNGYYDITLLAPDYNDQIGSSNTEDGYTQDMCAIIGLQPDNGKTDVSNVSLVNSLGASYQTNDRGYHFVFFTYTTPYPHDVTCSVGAGYQDENGKVVCLSDYGSKTLVTGVGYQQSTVSALDVSSFKPGKTYKICLIEKDGDGDWQLCDGANVNFITFSVSANGVVSRVDNDYNLDAALSLDNFKVGEETSCNIHFTNSGLREYCDLFYFMTSTTNENPMAYTYAAGITVEASNYNDITFDFTPSADTVYYWIMDVNSNLIKSGFICKANYMDVPLVNAHDDLLVSSQNGMLSVEVKSSALYNVPVRVCSAAGVVIVNTSLSAGQSISKALIPGVYFVNGRKVVVQ